MNPNETIETPGTLMILENMNPVTLFQKDGLNEILDRIEKEALSIITDISTAKGRKEVASLAYKIAKAKTQIDDTGKDLVSGLKEQTKAIDEERRKARERLDALKEKVRKPLTDWEEKEQARLAGFEERIKNIISCRTLPEETTAINISRQMDFLQCPEGPAPVGFDWGDFKERAERELNETLRILEDKYTAREEYEDGQKELQRLRDEARARAQKDREDAIAKEAAERAKREAEEIAERQRKAAELKAAQERKAIEEKAKREREAAESESKRKEAEAQAKIKAAAERERKLKEEAERQKREADAAKIKAEKEKLEAVERERQRIAAEQKRIADEQAKREADDQHAIEICEEAKFAIMKYCIKEEAYQIVYAIKRGEIPHVKIVY